LHTIPSGIFHDGKSNVIGNGVVIDPVVFKKEIDALVSRGVNVKGNLKISRKAHLIIPSHRLIDAASEAAKGKEKIGSTLKGIGPAYMDKTGRNGLRVGDIEHPDFLANYKKLVDKHISMLKQYDFEYDLPSMEQGFFEGIELLKELTLIDSEYELNNNIRSGQSVLAEGAQGSLLDVDFGSYPFVTSSHTVTAGTCIGLGIPPSAVGEVYGIFKAYCTRVGSGPFPTELFDETGDELRKKGNEFGSTTGRARRCGWLDLPSLNYAIMLNGVTQLIMMKSDVLSGFEKIKVCTHYKYRGQIIDYVPYDVVNEPIEPVYEELLGWSEDLTGYNDLDQLPQAFLNYISYIENATGLPITILSVGPDRKQTMVREAVFK
jgi:adenylosuccinate synthase